MCKQLKLNLPVAELKEMKGETCHTKWCRGKYAEVSINNNWDGTVTCPKCNRTVPSRIKTGEPL